MRDGPERAERMGAARGTRRARGRPVPLNGRFTTQRTDGPSRGLSEANVYDLPISGIYVGDTR